MSGDASGRSYSYCRRHTSVASNTTYTELYCSPAFPYAAKPMTRSLFSSPSHYHIYFLTDVVATEQGTYILYATLLKSWAVSRTTLVRPTWKWLDFQTGVVSRLVYLTIWAVLKTEVGLHSKGISLKMISKGFVLFEINSSPSAFYIIKPTCIVIGF